MSVCHCGTNLYLGGSRGDTEVPAKDKQTKHHWTSLEWVFDQRIQNSAWIQYRCVKLCVCGALSCFWQDITSQIITRFDVLIRTVFSQTCLWISEITLIQRSSYKWVKCWKVLSSFTYKSICEAQKKINRKTLVSKHDYISLFFIQLHRVKVRGVSQSYRSKRRQIFRYLGVKMFSYKMIVVGFSYATTTANHNRAHLHIQVYS